MDGCNPNPDFALDGMVTSAAAGQAGTSTVTVTRLNGFVGTINLTCASAASAKISCSLSPASITFQPAEIRRLRR